VEQEKDAPVIKTLKNIDKINKNDKKLVLSISRQQNNTFMNIIFNIAVIVSTHSVRLDF